MNDAAPERTALWPIPVNDLAGVARHVLDVGKAGLPGWHLVVLCPPGPLAESAADAGIDVRADAFGKPAGMVDSLRTLRRTVRELQPEIVHTHLAYADLIAAGVGAGRRGHLVSTEHGISTADTVLHESSAMSALMQRIHRIRQRRLDGLIAVSNATLEAVRIKWHPPRTLTTTVIPNGIDRPEPTPHREAGMRIGAVGRLVAEKNLPMLIDAFAIVHESYPEASLTLAGEGVLHHELEAMVATRGLADVVRFPGYVDSASIFASLDVVVMPSVFENCSYTLLEAAASGCGVVATDVGGNGEILPAQSVVPLGDTAAMAEAIIREALNPSARPGLAASWPTVAEMCAEIVAFYERIIA